MLEFEYARSALKNGLKLEQQLGINPYKFGLVGSTDAHTGLAAVDEDNFFGKTTPQEPSPERMRATFFKQCQDRREDHGLGGRRLRLRRRLGHGEHARGDLGRHGAQGDLRHDRARAWWCASSAAGTSTRPMPRRAARRSSAIRKGVPMGGDLRKRAGRARRRPSSSPRCKDPIGANLDRIQIVKGWLDAKGELQEKVYDVAWSGDRKPGADGKLPPVGNTVDVANATLDQHDRRARADRGLEGSRTSTPAQRAFYYVRVIEIPTPRWTAYDAKCFGTDAAARTRDDACRSAPTPRRSGTRPADASTAR